MVTAYTRARLVRIPPSGMVRNDEGKYVSTLPFLNQEGSVVNSNDSGYDVDRPTGYESVYYLIDFNGARLWIPRATYVGEDLRTNRDIWNNHLELYV